MQGSGLTFIGLDEIQQLDESNVIYMLQDYDLQLLIIKKQIQATGNPDYDAFIRHWVEFALDERGIPIRKDYYPLRYFLQVGENIAVGQTHQKNLKKSSMILRKT